MKNFYILLSLFMSLNLYSHAQEKDTYQPDSVIKANGVRTKVRYYENTISKAKQIYNFDKQGRLVEYILTSNSDENETQFNILYHYNDKNQLAKEIYRSTGTPVSKARITEYTYSADGSYKAVEYVGEQENVISEIVFEADSAKQTRKLMTNGQVRRENISYFERPFYTYKFKGSEITNQSQQKTFKVGGKEFRVISEDNWEYNFENKYDSAGRIIERTRIVKGEIKDKSLYNYNSEGLLTEKVHITYRDGKESMGKELFSYIKW